jgi:hypothetical protein
MIARAKAEFAQGPLPRPKFTFEGALALQHALPTPPSVIRWNARRDAITVEGHLDVVDRVASALKTWRDEPLVEPRSPSELTETDTRVLALYTRLNALVLRDVVIRKDHLKDAVAALNQLCVAAAGKKTGGLGISLGNDLTQDQGEPIFLEAKEITAWEALKKILRQGAHFAQLYVHRGRLVASSGFEADGFPMGTQLDDKEGLAIGEYPGKSLPLDLLAGRYPPAGSRAKDFLSSSGVTFNTGTFAMYSPAAGTLVLKDTPEFLLQVKKRVWEDYSSPPKRKARAAIRPVEIDGNRPVPEKTHE